MTREKWMLGQMKALGFRMAFAERGNIHQAHIIRGDKGGESRVLAANGGDRDSAMGAALDEMVKRFRLSPDAMPDSEGVQRAHDVEGDRRKPNTADTAFLSRHGLTYRITTVVRGMQPPRHKCQVVNAHDDRIRYEFIAERDQDERAALEGAIAMARADLGSGKPTIDDEPEPGSSDDRISQLERQLEKAMEAVNALTSAQAAAQSE